MVLDYSININWLNFFNANNLKMKTLIKNTIYILFLIFFSLSKANAQSNEQLLQKIQGLKTEIQTLQNELNKLKISNNRLFEEFSGMKINLDNQSRKLDSLSASVLKNNENINNSINELNTKMLQTDKTAKEQITDLNQTVSNNTIYWVAAVLAIALLSLLLFLFLRKQLSKNKTDLIDNIKETSNKIREEQLKLDEELINLFDKQMQLIQEEENKKKPDTEEINHELAKKLATEVIRIQNNLLHMDQNVKGVSNLKNRVKAIMDNFAANDYEILDLLNKPYDQGMNLIATMEPDESLKPGEEIIKRVIKPQVNYKGKMIQAAEVVVAYKE